MKKHFLHARDLVLSILVSGLFFGCHTPKDPNEDSGYVYEALPLMNLYPSILPAEKQHPVIVRTKKFPPSLTEEDIREIISLVGRVPGIHTYEILGLYKPQKKLAIDPEADISRVIEVYTPSFVLIMEKESGNWRFRQYWGHSH